MRQICDGLRDLLKLHAAKFIQQKGKYDSEWKFQDTALYPVLSSFSSSYTAPAFLSPFGQTARYR